MYPVSDAFLEAVKQNTRNYYWTGKITTSAGVYTIVEVKDGKGSEAGWGRLKSGAG